MGVLESVFKDNLWLLLPAALFFIVLNLGLIRPYDFWWHLRTGQIILTQGLPTVDFLSFTRAGEPWVNQAWLSQAGLYLLYAAGGLPLVILAQALLITSGYVLLEMACLGTARGSARAAAMAVLAAGCLGMSNWSVRPQAVSFLLFGALVYLLERGQRHRGWALPVLFVLWANSHGGFVFGLVLLAVYAAAEAWDVARASGWRRGAAAFLVRVVPSAAAVSLNPAGPLGLVRYVVGFATSGATQVLNAEFLPLDVRASDGLLFLAFTITLAVVAYARRVRPSPAQLLALVLFGAWTLMTRRALSWFGMAGAPFLAAALAPAAAAMMAPGRPRAVSQRMMVALYAVLMVVSLPWLRPLWPAAERRGYVAVAETPVQAAEVLCRQPAGRVFSEIGYASYLAWACPRTRVFIDTRFELYPPAMWSDYLWIGEARPGWEERLVRSGADAILASKRLQPRLAAAASGSAMWQTVYEDGDSVLLLRH